MILNKTKNKVIAKNKKFLTSPFSKAIGLMFSPQIKDTGYIFVFGKPIRIDLHMFFVFFPIDLIFLDENKRIIELKQEFRPFNLYYSKKKAKYLIEFSNGTIKKTKVEIGDNISF